MVVCSNNEIVATNNNITVIALSVVASLAIAVVFVTITCHTQYYVCVLTVCNARARHRESTATPVNERAAGGAAAGRGAVARAYDGK